MKPTYRRLAALVVAAGVLAAVPAFADPPNRIARLNYLKGSVSFRPAAVEDWTTATLNDPLTTGDHLWTEPNSWAELHIGSTAIRLAPTTAFAFLNLDDRVTQVRLSEGSLDVRVRNLDGSEVFEIATPSAAVTLTRPGVYRVDVMPDGGSARVTVRYGAASVNADGADFWVREGETASLSGTDDVSYEVYRAVEPDNWERWCRDRDEREERAASVRYVSYEMTGYEDLDEYGTWSTIPDYGWAWRPRVAVGWAPYRHGHWRWISPWGWTWIDQAAWGFAPFHYGRWTCRYGAWYWVPGSYALRPVYAPALVAFIGGDNWGLSFGFGRSHVGWFPLAPGEFWMPHYRASHGYIRNLNVTNVNIRNINITNYNVSRGTYVNRAVNGAVTAVPRDAFVGRRAVARDALAVDARAAMRAPVIGTSAALSPRAESVLGGRRTGSLSRPPADAFSRPVVARSRPPAAPAPFAAQARAIEANGGRPLDDSAMGRLRAEQGSGDDGAPVRIAGARSRRGEPANAGSLRGEGASSGQPGPASTGSWGGAAARRGERAPDGATPEAAGGNANVRPGVNDRPSWARPRGDAGTSPSPVAGDDGRVGVRGRPGAGAPDTSEGDRGVGSRPGYVGGARPRGGDSPSSGESSRPNDRPSSVRPSGGESTRPSGGEGARPAPAGARPRGGDSARPAPESRPSGGDSRPSGGARPRSGGGGDSAYYPSSSPSSRSVYANDRPPEAWSSRRSAVSSRSYAGPTGSQAGGQASARTRWNDRPVAPEMSRPSPQYRSAPPDSYSAGSGSAARSRAMSEYRGAPESSAGPRYRTTPEARSMPSYRSVPEARSMPSYGSAPQTRSMPSYGSAPRSYSPPPQSRSYGGAVERGGGGRAPQASPSRPSSGGGQAAPRGARSRGRD